MSLVYERASFGASAVAAVAPLVAAYAAGAPLYLARDVAVRAFYALGDGASPARVSACAIAANAVLDYLLCVQLNLGAVGLVAATAFVNTVSALALLASLSKRIGGIALPSYARPVLVMFGATGIGTVASAALWAIGSEACAAALASTPIVHASAGAGLEWILRSCALGVAGFGGAAAYASVLVAANLEDLRPAVQTGRRLADKLARVLLRR